MPINLNPFHYKGPNIIPPHEIKSREVNLADIPRVMKNAEKMVKLMSVLMRHNMFWDIYALAHSQITKYDPLRFFVFRMNSPEVKQKWANFDGSISTPRSTIIINPQIIRHTKTAVKREEGCVTFPGLAPQWVERWNKCDVTFQDTSLVPLTTPISLTGKISEVFQHEIDHMDGKYAYPWREASFKEMDKIEKSHGKPTPISS